MHKDSKIFVAGHRGLVGSAIVKNLEAKGYTNLVYRKRSELDLRDTAAVTSFFETEQPECVFLAAAKVGGIIANNTYRADFIYENLMIQNNVIHQAYKAGVKKLLFLGSTCIYPKNCPQPMKEEYLLTDTLEYTNEPYAIAKIAGIKMCESYNLQYGTNFISVMPTNLYGPNDNFDLEKSHVLPALMRKMHLGKALEQNDWDSLRADLNKLPIEGVDGTDSEAVILNILKKYGISGSSPFEGGQEGGPVHVEVWGSGKPRREFLWSEDMADACVFIMENRDFTDVIPNGSEVRNTHINIGTGEDISIKDLARLIQSQINFQGVLVFNSNNPDGTMRKLTNPKKIHALGWRAQVSLEEGIKRMYSWYLKQTTCDSETPFSVRL
ncbi:GDP-L-fucose synthase family protein [Leeuwenhoekiella polynyae]|uniref:GDP-L-fucose synthase n=1 Tax=Leeuwenhoekiella polynyae TaxID=1550906 RepID=A0A4Q0PFB8_9FLAO|nr:GDP-L-fucose synthase [Leeuwenhoekiella polynyae]RXG25617.1 GDP-L-fucose synthase [Leeuwenhoekiella polynyae]